MYCYLLWWRLFLTIRFAGMGNLLKVLTREIENYPHFFLDFESKCGGAVGQKLDGEGGVACSALSSLSVSLCSQWPNCEGVLLFSPLFSSPPSWLGCDLPQHRLWSPVANQTTFFSPFFRWLFNITHALPPFFLLSLSCRNQMGNLLKVLTCTEFEQGPNFFLDFESERSFCLSSCSHALLSPQPVVPLASL